MNVFDLIHTNIWGLINIPFVLGHRYFLTIVDDYTRHIWIYLMKAKSETGLLLHNFVFLFSKNQFGRNIKIIRFNNGKEFIFSNVYDKFRILHQMTLMETPQNSGFKRKHQDILNITRSLMIQFSLPKASPCCLPYK